MSDALFDTRARRRTVSLTVNGDLLDQAKTAGINVSRTAEAALVEALTAWRQRQVKDEIARDLRAMEDYVDQHGNPATELRRMFGGVDFDAT